jgi:hypothetical protein
VFGDDDCIFDMLGVMAVSWREGSYRDFSEETLTYWW